MATAKTEWTKTLQKCIIVTCWRQQQPAQRQMRIGITKNLLDFSYFSDDGCRRDAVEIAALVVAVVVVIVAVWQFILRRVCIVRHLFDFFFACLVLLLLLLLLFTFTTEIEDTAHRCELLTLRPWQWLHKLRCSNECVRHKACCFELASEITSFAVCVCVCVCLLLLALQLQAATCCRMINWIFNGSFILRHE